MKSLSMRGQALTDLHTRVRRGLQIALLTAVILPACTREDPSATAKPYDAKVSEEAKPAITNRVDIPASVRQNLGMTFAKVESRPVAATLRLPGALELPPTAMRPSAGRASPAMARTMDVLPAPDRPNSASAPAGAASLTSSGKVPTRMRKSSSSI